MAIFEEVKEIITKYIKVDADKITLESRLNEDLDADSIDVADVVMDIEEKYGFEFSDEDAENIVEIKDLVRVIEEDMEESEDVFDFDNEGIVSKFNIATEEEEF